MLRSIPIMLVTAAVLVLTACTGADADTAEALADADLVVVAEDTAFVEPPTAIAAGTHRIGLENRGRAPHDVTVEGLGTVVVADGRGHDIAEVALAPGHYVVWCDVPGHRAAGMEFALEVRER